MKVSIVSKEPTPEKFTLAEIWGKPGLYELVNKGIDNGVVLITQRYMIVFHAHDTKGLRYPPIHTTIEDAVRTGWDASKYVKSNKVITISN